MKTKLPIMFASALLGLWLGGQPDLVRRRAPTDTPVKPRDGQPAAPATAALRAAIDRGAAFLLKSQNSNGWWSTPEQPAVTALVLTALNLEPSGRFQRSRPSELARAYDFILASAKPDGSIQRSGLANYNTSLCLIALVSAFDTNFTPVILAARRYIASTQIDFGAPGTNDTPFDGGIGYGSKYQHSDMNNTLTAIEAMRMSEVVLSKDRPASFTPEADVNWAAVASFLQHCQNLPSHNTARLGFAGCQGSRRLRLLPREQHGGRRHERGDRARGAPQLRQHELRRTAELYLCSCGQGRSARHGCA